MDRVHIVVARKYTADGGRMAMGDCRARRAHHSTHRAILCLALPLWLGVGLGSTARVRAGGTRTEDMR